MSQVDANYLSSINDSAVLSEEPSMNCSERITERIQVFPANFLNSLINKVSSRFLIFLLISLEPCFPGNSLPDSIVESIIIVIH